MELPKRKPNRLAEYDYSQNGAYFMTVCTKNRKPIFWDEDANVGANCVRPLSQIGIIVDDEIQKMNKTYPEIKIDKYVIMPDHIHFIISIQSEIGRTQFAPTISRTIKQFKGTISKQVGVSIWQKSYFDHIIRNRQDYDEIWKYIDQNPARWMIKNQIDECDTHTTYER